MVKLKGDAMVWKSVTSRMFCTCALMSLSFLSVYGETIKSPKIRTSGKPGTLNELYGYASTSQGPGETAFSDCLEMATGSNILMMVIYGKDGCSTCDAFATSFNNDTGRTLAIGGTYNGYFRGSAKACNDAYAFFSAGTSDKDSEGLKSAGGPKGTCHLLGFYGVAPNGKKFKYSGVCPTTYKAFRDIYINQKSLWGAFKKDNQVTAAARFANKNTSYARLEATESTKAGYVPFVKTSLVDIAETDTFIVSYPDGSATTNEILWVAGESNKVQSVDVDGKWVAEGKVNLELFDIAGNRMDLSAINFVAGSNTFSFPDMEFDENGSWGQWTLYSEDSWNAATQKVYAANMYSQPDTNDNATVEHVVMDIPIAPSNRYEVVYTDDIAFFPEERVDFTRKFNFTVTNQVTTVYTNDLTVFESAKDDEDVEFTAIFPAALQIVTNYVENLEGMEPYDVPESKTTNVVTVTNYVYGVASSQDENPVEWTWACSTEDIDVECFTNCVEYALTNEVYAAGDATTNYVDLVLSATGKKSYCINQKLEKGVAEIPVSESFASNCVYAVTPQAGLYALTNLYSSVEATFSGVVEVCNEITVLPCDGTHAEPSSSTVAKDDDQQPVVKDFEVADVATYYIVQSNRQEIVGQEHTVYGTNRTFYVELPGCVTNEDVSAQAPVLNCGEIATTNFYYVALTNAEHEVASTEVTWTNFEAMVAVDCTNFYYTVATNEYQYGKAGNEAGGRSDKGIQSFVLKVTGGTVWNADTVAFASVLESDIFREWCESNQVATLIHECSDPDTGASLFSHKVASNGRSGSAYLSRNGLVEGCEQPPASNVFEVALYRPDGSLAGILAPQTKGGKCDLDENMTRLRELRELAEDLTEPANGDAATSGLKAYYGRTILTEPSAETYTLDVSDKKDVFEITDIPQAGMFVSIDAAALPATRYDGLEKPRVKVWRYTSAAKTATREIPAAGVDPEGAPVWRFGDDDLNLGVYADVTAWTNDYAATETFGGSQFLYALTVLEAKEFPGVVSFVNSSNEMYDVDSETTIELKVNRSGYTGEATATLKLESELPDNCYSWINGNNETNLVWKAGDPAVKSVFVTVRNVTWEDSVSNMVFTISATTGAGLDEERKTCKIGIQQEDDEKALTGRIYISGPEVVLGETIWKKSSVPVDVVITRERVLNEATGKSEARGEATASLSATGGATLSTNKVEWLNGSRTGDRAVQLKMPDVVSGTGQQIVELSVLGVDSDGKQIQDISASKLKFCVVPSDAPEFMNNIDAKAYQYVDFNELAYLVYEPEKMEMVEANLIAGALPAGLSASADETMGGLCISGRPTGTGSATATYQLTLRRKADGRLVKTMPVTVKIEGKALGGDGSGSSGAVIPGFAIKRVWQYLPMTNGEQKLVGMLNLSVSTKGSISARYTMPGKTVSFSAESLDNVAEDASAGGYRAYSEMNRAGYRLDVSFATSGEVVANVTSEDGEVRFVSEAGSVPWSNVPGGASAWRGRYVAAFPQAGASSCGIAAIALNISSPAMAKAGKVTYSGVLPNGKPMNGTTALLPAAENADSVRLPILWSSAAESFSAMLVVSKTQTGATVACDPCVKPSWSGDEESELSAVGTSFVAEDWATAWARDFNGAKALRFKFGGNVGAATVAPDGMAVKVGEAGSVAADGFELESIVLNRVSGVVTGSVRKKLDTGHLVQVGFRGVALPGDKERFMVGSAWYLDEKEGVSLRRAVPVEIVPAE